MGSWSGVSNYDSSQTYLPQLGEDGSLRFEYKSAVKPERNFSFEGKVTAVSSTVISYERDGYYSDYFQYELSADGQTLILWYQDHEGSLRRGGTPALVPGDASGDGRLDDKDLEAFVNMLVRGPLPALPHGADADQNSQINLDDLLWLIDRMV